MRIAHVADSDFIGGACRAAYRIHSSLVCHGGRLDTASQMVVKRKVTSDPTVKAFSTANCAIYRPCGLLGRFKSRIVKRYYRSFRSDNPILHSVAADETGLGIVLNHSDFDLINLHWLGNSTLSIEEIGRLKRPVAWTLHDQWAFCGAEHYVCPPPVADDRFAVGYTANSRRKNEFGPDLNRNVWLRKRKSWDRPMNIVCPSHWLASCVRRSALMKHWSVTVIPNCLDLSVFKPGDQRASRDSFGLPQDKTLLLFGAMGGAADTRKGGDLLFETLSHLRLMGAPVPNRDFEIVVFGQEASIDCESYGYPVHNVGVINDDERLRDLYVSGDMMIIPSRQDNLPNTGIEAHACGTPVVAFDVGGLPEIVDHKVTGALAEPFSTTSLAEAIFWVASDPVRRRNLSEMARLKAERVWSGESVARRYADFYRLVLQGQES